MKRSVRGTLARSLAAAAMVLLYGIGALGVTSFTDAAPAQARRGRRGGGRGRGRGRRGRRGGGIHFGAPFLYGGYDDGCYWSPRRARWVCPYNYSPYRYYW